MGWNTLHKQDEHALLDGIETGPPAARLFRPPMRWRRRARRTCKPLTEHGGPVTAMVARGNIGGTQFHPEKSQKLGPSSSPPPEVAP
jgi:glutamine amidotransferase